MASDIAENVNTILARVALATSAAGRNQGDVRVLLATKTQPVAVIEQAIDAICHQKSLSENSVPNDGDIAHHISLPILVGENRVQEIVAKAPDLVTLVNSKKLELHLIGPLQRNKINAILSHPVTTIQSVDSFELASAISDRLARSNRRLSVMLQVNVSGEPSKSGSPATEALQVAQRISEIPNLELVGFMAIGYPPVIVDGEITNEQQISSGYQILREIRDAALAAGITTAQELSMGMSADLELAIAAGATIVRVGSGVFGARPVAARIPIETTIPVPGA